MSHQCKYASANGSIVTLACILLQIYLSDSQFHLFGLLIQFAKGRSLSSELQIQHVRPVNTLHGWGRHDNKEGLNQLPKAFNRFLFCPRTPNRKETPTTTKARNEGEPSPVVSIVYHASTTSLQLPVIQFPTSGAVLHRRLSDPAPGPFQRTLGDRVPIPSGLAQGPSISTRFHQDYDSETRRISPRCNRHAARLTALRGCNDGPDSLARLSPSKQHAGDVSPRRLLTTDHQSIDRPIVSPMPP